ncbi:MAG TPA: prepilin-type N-terminal cleavage/methylation domain-containing protein [Flavobacterium sp.]|jgi:type II secretory pathway pseudopilin PulG
MQKNKVPSFTLSELLVVMIITVIIVGIAFSVLNLVKKEIVFIEKNYSKKTVLLLFEQKLWQDFNQYQNITFDPGDNTIRMESEIDTIVYRFSDDYSIRQDDTLRSKIEIDKLYLEGKETKEGPIDAISLSSNKEIPEYAIFVFKENDATFFMNNDGI